MNGYMYKRTEDELWTVGTYTPDGTWEPESDWGHPDEAAARVHFLNGGTSAVTLKQARMVIEGILAVLPDKALPKPDKVETEADGVTVVWFGSHGHYLGSSRNGWGEHIPGGSYRLAGSYDALTAERVRRLDLKHPRVETTRERQKREAATA